MLIQYCFVKMAEHCEQQQIKALDSVWVLTPRTLSKVPPPSPICCQNTQIVSWNFDGLYSTKLKCLPWAFQRAVPEFDPTSVNLGSVVDNIPMGHASLQVIRFSVSESKTYVGFVVHRVALGHVYIHIVHTVVFPKYLAGVHSQTQHINNW
jgi:hypothetical protein